MENLALSEAYDKKQQAYEERAKIRAELNALKPKLSEAYEEIGMLQAQYEQVYAESQKEWNDFKQALTDFKTRIGYKNEALQEAKDLEEKFQFLAQEEDVTEDKARLYEEAAAFFKDKQNRFLAEKNLLLDEKHQLKEPDNTARDELLATLKQKRAEQQELRAEHNSLKERLTRSNLAFSEAQKEYFDIKNSDFYDINEERKKEERRVEILTTARVPKEFWNSATIKESGDIIDIYYGGDKDHAHGHISLNSSKVIYTREPRLSTAI